MERDEPCETAFPIFLLYTRDRQRHDVTSGVSVVGHDGLPGVPSRGSGESLITPAPADTGVVAQPT